MPDFNSIRNAVANRCSSKWYEIGLMILELTDDEIRRATFDIPSPTGKLLALIEARRAEVGGEKTAEDLWSMVCNS